ncbi:serine-rich adhesin for platelets-like [Octopus sinensis]|uniref:Serine-rich adhesin for platelets-like n=1 Tax=Octopus sinensis TaxID=2607531 RepID=A0A7E6EK29_9MOLL|nr:serine-rich adhesin for platelets-like [Octopus sinensis]
MEFLSSTSFIKWLIIGSILTLSGASYRVCDEENVHLGISDITKQINGSSPSACVWKVSAREEFGLKISVVLSDETFNNHSFSHTDGAVSVLIYDENPLNSFDSRLINRIDLNETDVTKSFLTNRSEIWMKVIHTNNSLDDISRHSLSIIYQAFSANQCRLPVNFTIGSASNETFFLGSVLNVTCDKDFPSMEPLVSAVVCLKNGDGIAVWNDSFAGCYLETSSNINDNTLLTNSSDSQPHPPVTNATETKTSSAENSNSSYLTCSQIFTDFSANISFNIYRYNTSICNFTIDVSEASSLEVTFYENDLISFVEISGHFLKESFNLTIDDIPRILELKTNKVSIIYHISNENNNTNNNDTSMFLSYLSKKKAKMCDPVDPPKHGYMTLTDNSPGSEVIFFCPAHHTLIGDSKTRCEQSENGTFHWTHPTPLCRCGNSLNVTNWSFSTVELNNLTVIGGTNCSWELTNDEENLYEIFIEFNDVSYKSLSLTIQDLNQTWEYSFDHSHSSGSYNFTTLSHIVNIYIDISANFLTQSGDLELTLRSIEPRRTCVIPSVNDGTVSVDTLTEGSIIDFSCNPGYTIIGESKALCVWNNVSGSLEWSSAIPSCVLYTCSEDNKTRNSTSGIIISPKSLNGTISQYQNCTWIINNSIPGTYTNLTLLYYHFPVDPVRPVFLRFVEVSSNGSEILLKDFHNNSLESETFISNSEQTKVYYRGPVLPAVAYKGFEVVYWMQETSESDTKPDEEISNTTLATNTTIDASATIATTNTTTNATTDIIDITTDATIDTTTTTTTTTTTVTTTATTSAPTPTPTPTTTTTTITTSTTVTPTTNNTTAIATNDTIPTWPSYPTSSTTGKPTDSGSSQRRQPITPTDKVPGKIDVYVGNDTLAGTKPPVPAPKVDVGAIVIGVTLPVLILMGIGIAVYIWYRKKYPVRMILGKEFQNFTNPLYVKSTNSVEINITSHTPASLVVKDPNPSIVPGQDNLAFDDETDSSKTTSVGEISGNSPQENKDSTDVTVLSKDDADDKSIEEVDFNPETNTNSISNDDNSDIEIVSKESSTTSEPALISISDDHEQNMEVVPENGSLDPNIVLVSLSDDEIETMDEVEVVDSNPVLNLDNLLVSFTDEPSNQ